MDISSRREPTRVRPHRTKDQSQSNNKELKPAKEKKTSKKRSPRQPIGVKLVVRLLPPNLEPEKFWKDAHVNPSQLVGRYFIKGHYSAKPYKLPVYSRAYLAFKTSEFADSFANSLKNVAFQDDKESLIPMITKSLYEKIQLEVPILKGFEEMPEYQRFLKWYNGEAERPESLLVVKKSKEAKEGKDTRVLLKKDSKKEPKKETKKKDSKKEQKPKEKKDSVRDSKKKEPKPKPKLKSKSNSPKPEAKDTKQKKPDSKEKKDRPKRTRKPKTETTESSKTKVLKRATGSEPPKPKPRPKILKRDD
jgi:regulator of nonsense transcripts 3